MSEVFPEPVEEWLAVEENNGDFMADYYVYQRYGVTADALWAARDAGDREDEPR